MPSHAPTARVAVYATSNQVLQRYGRKSRQWLWRMLRNDPDFPRPIQMSGLNYWVIAELEAYEAARQQQRNAA